MKRLFVFLMLVTGSSCQPDKINATCYVCDVYTTTQASHQTKEFCNKAEMDQYVQNVKAQPETTLVSCRNK
ncbi:hypothetical protein [Fibrisoma limi]|nr:hypothetical protein [Fibrisoma limi]